jgi:hypothetical protein
MRQPLALEPSQFPMQAPGILIFYAGPPHHAPAFTLAGVVASLNASLQVLLLNSSAIYNTGTFALPSTLCVAAFILGSPG